MWKAQSKGESTRVYEDYNVISNECLHHVYMVYSIGRRSMILTFHDVS
jgi:hypothetical protein